MRLDLSPHAVSRMVEFGIGEDVVGDIVSRPSVRYPSPRARYSRGDVFQSATYPEWAVVADPPDVITVLRRELDRWEHELATPYASTASTLRAVEDDRPDPTPPGSPVQRRRSEARVPRTAVVSQRVEPCVLALAQQLADGDLRRLVLRADGAVIVLNRARRGHRSGVGSG